LFPRSRKAGKAHALAASIQAGDQPKTPVAMTPDGRIVWNEYALPTGTLLVAPDAPREVIRQLALAALSNRKVPVKPDSRTFTDNRSSYARLKLLGELVVKSFPLRSDPLDSSAAALCANIALTAGLEEQDAGYGDWRMRGAQYYGMFQPAGSTAATWVMERVRGEASAWHVSHSNPRRERTPNLPQRTAMFAAAVEAFGVDSTTVLADGNTRNLLVTRNPDTFVKFDARIREDMLPYAWAPVPAGQLIALQNEDTMELARIG